MKTIFAFFALLMGSFFVTNNASAQSRGTYEVARGTTCPSTHVYQEMDGKCYCAPRNISGSTRVRTDLNPQGTRLCDRSSRTYVSCLERSWAQLNTELRRLREERCQNGACRPATPTEESTSRDLLVQIAELRRLLTEQGVSIADLNRRMTAVEEDNRLQWEAIRTLEQRPTTVRRDTVRTTSREVTTTKRDATDRQFAIGTQVGYAQSNLQYPTVGITIRASYFIAQADIGLGGSGTFTLTSNCAPACGRVNPTVDVPSTGSYRRISVGGVIPVTQNVGLGGGISHVSESAKSNADFSFGSKSGFGGFGFAEFKGNRYFGSLTGGFANHPNLGGLGLGNSDGLFGAIGGGVRF